MYLKGTIAENPLNLRQRKFIIKNFQFNRNFF